ncbi:MAG: vWA domain-containing protein [bacterium]
MNSRFLNTIKNFFTDHNHDGYHHGFYPSVVSGGEKSRNLTLEGNSLDIILLDVSGSMAERDYPPSRLAAAKDASFGFLKQLQDSNPNACVGVVSFSTRARIVHQPVRLKDDYARIGDVIDNLRCESSTNIAEGLTISKAVISKCKGASVPRVLMLTDGYDNEGGNPEQIAQELKGRGIQLDIIGIGGSPAEVNEPQLERMASVVDGELHYWFIRSVGDLVRKFEVLALREVK